jgi:hypothetical protein
VQEQDLVVRQGTSHKVPRQGAAETETTCLGMHADGADLDMARQPKTLPGHGDWASSRIMHTDIAT